MSLILDALRKADAERERGALPNLHSQPVHATAEAPRKASVGPTWLWIAFGATFGLVGAVVWVWMSARYAPAPSAVTANAVPAPQSTAVPVPPPMAVNVPPSPPAAVTNAQTAAEPAPWPQPAERKAPGAAKGESQVITLGNVPPAGPGVYTREQLPPDVRAALPQLAIGGSVYSPDPASRSLIVNGRLVREKERLSDELSLEEIKLRAAIFRFRGYRVEVMF